MALFENEIFNKTKTTVVGSYDIICFSLAAFPSVFQTKFYPLLSCLNKPLRHFRLQLSSLYLKTFHHEKFYQKDHFYF
jgi:hypothetical protein